MNNGSKTVYRRRLTKSVNSPNVNGVNINSSPQKIKLSSIVNSLLIYIW